MAWISCFWFAGWKRCAWSSNSMHCEFRSSLHLELQFRNFWIKRRNWPSRFETRQSIIFTSCFQCAEQTFDTIFFGRTARWKRRKYNKTVLSLPSFRSIVRTILFDHFDFGCPHSATLNIIIINSKRISPKNLPRLFVFFFFFCLFPHWLLLLLSKWHSSFRNTIQV